MSSTRSDSDPVNRSTNSRYKVDSANGNLYSSAFGGRHLPAMQSLWPLARRCSVSKLGDERIKFASARNRALIVLRHRSGPGSRRCGAGRCRGRGCAPSGLGSQRGRRSPGARSLGASRCVGPAAVLWAAMGMGLGGGLACHVVRLAGPVVETAVVIVEVGILEMAGLLVVTMVLLIVPLASLDVGAPVLGSVEEGVVIVDSVHVDGVVIDVALLGREAESRTRVEPTGLAMWWAVMLHRAASLAVPLLALLLGLSHDQRGQAYNDERCHSRVPMSTSSPRDIQDRPGHKMLEMKARR